MTTTDNLPALRPRGVVAVPTTEPAMPAANVQVKPMPLWVGMAGSAGLAALLATWSWWYAGRTGLAQTCGIVAVLLVIAAFVEGIRSRP